MKPRKVDRGPAVADRLADDAYAAALWRKVARDGFRADFGPGSDRVAANRLRRLVGFGGDVPSTYASVLQPGWRETLRAEVGA